MSLSSLVRRSVAVTSATALVSGVLGAGVLATPAQAAPLPAASITKVSPESWDNRSEVTLTLTGETFLPGDKVELQPACSDDPAAVVPAGATCAPLEGREVVTISTDADPPIPVDEADPSGTMTMDAFFDLSMAAPGRYRVVVRHRDNTPSNPFTYFRIFGYGAANVATVATGLPVTAKVTVPLIGLSDCIATDFAGAGCGRNGPLPLDIKGSNFALGAKVEFLLESDNTVDEGLTFAPGNPSNGSNVQGTTDDTGYPSASLIQGDYTTVVDGDQKATFTPGWHKVRVKNTDGRTTGTTARFAQPYFAPEGSLSLPTAADPNPAPNNTIGQGAKNRLLRVTGAGIRAGSKLYVERKTSSTCSDVTVGASTVGGLAADGLYSWIEAPLTFADCTTPNDTDRKIGIEGPDGGRFYRNAFLKIGGRPSFGSFDQDRYKTMGQGAREGFDGQPADGLFIHGSNFVGAGETDPAKMTAFSFGPGTTVTTRSVDPAGTFAFVSVAIDPEAGTGERLATAVNPNGAQRTTDCERLDTGDCDPTIDGNDPKLVITAGPKITKSVVAADSPTQSLSPGQLDPTKFDVTGSGFQATGYSGAQFVVALPGQTTQDPDIQIEAVQRTSATALNFRAYARPNAVAGPRDLIIENDDHGRVVCAGCLGIDSLGVSPGTASNTGVTSPAVGLTVLVNSLPALTSGSTVTLSHQAPLPGQPEIPATTVTATDSKHGSAVFDLTDAALGRYNVTVVLDPNGTKKTVSCTGCFTVTGTAMTLDAEAPVAPSAGAQGVRDWKLTFKGTGFTKGVTVSIPDVTVHDVTFVSPTQITALVDVADAVATEAKSGTVTSGDGTSSPFTFTVTAKPSVTAGSAAPAAYGAGAGSPGSPTPAPTFSVDGNGFSSDPATQVVLGTGVEATGEAVTEDTSPLCALSPGQCTDDKVTATLAIAQDAVAGKRAVTVVNETDGGSATLADAFTVNPGPKVSSVANAKGQSVLCRPATGNGCTNPQAITVIGSDFPNPAAEDEKAAAFKVLNADGTEATGVTVTDRVFAPGKITANVAVEATRALGPLQIAIFNAADKGFASCTGCLAVAVPPTVPTALKLVAGAGSLTATWVKPAGDFGSEVSGYRLELKRSGTTTTTVLGTTATTYTFTGLANGATYTVAVQAVNAAGLSPKATATGIPGLAATLVAKQSAKTVTYGSRVVYTGKLTRTGSTVGLPGRAIRLTFVPLGGKAFSQTVTTSSTGTWAFTYTPRIPSTSLSKVSQYSVKVYPAFLGDSTYRKATATTMTTFVAPRVKISSPVSGSRTSASTAIKVTGSILPSKAGRTVYLYRFTSSGRTLIARTTVSSSSTFAFSIRPSRGTYTLRAYIPATPGNVAAYSPSVVIYRV